MKKIIFGLIVLALLLWLVWVAIHRSAPSPASSNVLTYNDPNGRFAFDYPSAFTVTGSTTDNIAKAYVAQSYQPHTNFSEAWIVINATGTARCSGSTTTHGAAAGNRYDETITLKMAGNTCYALDEVIHYGNIQNYDPSMGITEFDEAKVQSDLDKIVQSFRSK